MPRKRYNWEDVQKLYDSGLSYRELTAKIGVTPGAIAKAVAKGLLKTRSMSEAANLKFAQGWTVTPMNDTAKAELSLRQSLRNTGGRCRWFEVSGQYVQGTWERDIAQKLDTYGIEWKKVRSREDSFRYELDGKTKWYSPDFYLPEYNLYIEVKGYWWGRDKEKMQAVYSQHPDARIVLVEKEQFEEIMNFDAG
jgi:hypothetical protein